MGDSHESQSKALLAKGDGKNTADSPEYNCHAPLGAGSTDSRRQERERKLEEWRVQPWTGQKREHRREFY